jgi:acetoin utilization deacetylase AcuC-like enzyme
MKIPVFYTPKMVADSQSASPSAAKPEKVVASWLSQFDVEIIEPTPVTTDELKRAHDADFVDGIMSLTMENGFGNKSPYVAAALPYTSGAMLCAARHALQTKKVAVAPVSGFHHAGTYAAEGYCTFNGLMVTALALKEEGLAQTVGILDFDMHYGNGTDEIINTQKIDWVRHFTAGRYFDHPNQTKSFFDSLPQILAHFVGCDVVLYQAGADPHINDPHGGWLTTDEMRQRDARVFEAFNALGIPVAWDLAGGYQVEKDGTIPKVLEIHDNTMRECVRVYGE